MTEQLVTQEYRNNACFISLNRANKRNALNPTMIAQLTEAIQAASALESLHYVLITAEGPCFSAGADLTHMEAMSRAPTEENESDASALALMLRTCYDCPHPLIIACRGSATGGALGLLACADFVIAHTDCVFRLSEVSLGIIPATISPYLMATLGPSRLLAYSLSGKAITATEALQAGLIHDISEDLEKAITTLSEYFQKNSPTAMRLAKAQCREIAPVTCDGISWLSKARQTPDAREGLQAFLEKRPPQWNT